MENSTIQKGQTSQYVVKLQQFLNMQGYTQPITGFFGNMTFANVQKYQSDHEQEANGIVDATLFNLINTLDRLDTWCHAIQSREGFFSPGENAEYPNGTPAWANNNPGNCVFIGQQNAVADGRFAKFNTYQDGYNYLKNLLIWACTDQSTPLYTSDMTLLEFYDVYAPASDGNDPISYSEEIAGKLGVSNTVAIKSLLI